MDNIIFFKKEAKKLFKDFKTLEWEWDEVVDDYLATFKPNFFDIDEIFLSLGIEYEELKSMTLMKSQHILAVLLGFESWSDLINSDKYRLEIAKIIFQNQDKVSWEDWSIHMDIVRSADPIHEFNYEQELELLEVMLPNFDTAISPYILNRRNKAFLN